MSFYKMLFFRFIHGLTSCLKPHVPSYSFVVLLQANIIVRASLYVAYTFLDSFGLVSQTQGLMSLEPWTTSQLASRIRTAWSRSDNLSTHWNIFCVTCTRSSCFFLWKTNQSPVQHQRDLLDTLWLSKISLTSENSLVENQRGHIDSC